LVGGYYYVPDGCKFERKIWIYNAKTMPITEFYVFFLKEFLSLPDSRSKV